MWFGRGPRLLRITGAWAHIQIFAAAWTESQAVLATVRRHRQLEQQRFPRIPAQIELPSVVEPHRAVPFEFLLVGAGLSTCPLRKDPERRANRQLEVLEAAEAFKSSAGFEIAAYRDAIAVPLDIESSDDRIGPLVIREFKVTGPEFDPDVARPTRKGSEIE